MNEDKLILLSGNPNVGKSSIFNILTGLHQHTGNWTGKTVSTQIGRIKKNKEYVVVDLPGTYSLLSISEEEVLARDAILFDNAYKNVVVIDSCFLERNLNLALQILEIDKNIILCLNLIDELKNKKIKINTENLSNILGIPVIMCSAKNNIGIDELIESLDIVKESHYNLNYGERIEKLIGDFIPLIGLEAIYNINRRFVALKLLEGDKTIVKSIYDRYGVEILSQEVNEFLRDINFEEIRREVSLVINKECEKISSQVIVYEEDINKKSRRIDKILTSKLWGIPIALLILMLIFYMTMVLANYPSQLLNNIFSLIEKHIYNGLNTLGVSKYISRPLMFGVFRTTSWVVSVMLPPMAIFFAMFSLGEECGFLPRIAFNFDKIFKKFKAHGKQALTMCMGFGCNACGVIGARIIDSPRDKLIAILTNNFIPCNGRFPLIISIITMFFVTSTSPFISGITSSLILTSLILFGIIISLITSRILSSTVLKGMPSHFTLELPIYRKPKYLNVIWLSIINKTFFVLIRAIKVAVPAGLLIWMLSNISIEGISILKHLSEFLNPFANLLGLDGIILLGFILALPANEIVIPIILMGYLNMGELTEINSLTHIKDILVGNGWTIMTALNVCLFSIMHFPCATTLLTIKKEVGSKWMVLAFLISTLTGLAVLFIINTVLI